MLNNKTNAAALYGNTFIMNVLQTTRELQLQTNVKNALDVGPRNAAHSQHVTRSTAPAHQSPELQR
jgi:hypothetical protein